MSLGKPGLSFPLGVISELRAGLFVLPIPINYPPGHINCYLLDDEYGVTIVDTGHISRPGMKTWESALKEPLLKNRVKQVYLTHGHPDHCGLAEWLCERTGATLLIHADELDAVRRLWRNGVFSKQEQYDFYREWGVGEDQLKHFIRLIEGFRVGMTDLEVDIELIEGGDRLKLGDREWTVIQGKGHTPSNCGLFCRDERILISGDHILPRIYPNVSLWWGASDNPLQEYLDSLEIWKALDCDIYLPSHGGMGKQYKSRIEKIEALHHRRLTAALDFCRAEAKLSMECITPVLMLPMDDEIVALLGGQIFAILNCLLKQGRLRLSEENPKRFIAS